MKERSLAPAVRTSERRQFGRRTACKPCWIVIDGRRVCLCLMINFSEGGAFIDPRGQAIAADTFHLLVEDEDLIVPCRVAHRTDGKIGVTFICPPSRASRWTQADARRNRSAVRMMFESEKK